MSAIAGQKELSAVDRMHQDTLPNWGRWGRHDPDKPDPHRAGHSVCVGMLRPKGSPDVWDGPTDAPLPPIDFEEAERTDALISQLTADHRDNIRRVYYKKEDIKDVGWERVRASIRALLDLTSDNRRTVDRMYALLYGANNGR